MQLPKDGGGDMSLDNGVIVAIVAAGGTIIVGLIGYLTARLTFKSTKTQHKVEERAKIIEGYDKLVEDLEARNQKYKDDMGALETRLTALENGRLEDRERIIKLEDDKRTQREALRQIINYCMLLVELLESNGISVPKEPDELKRYAANKAEAD